MVQIRFLARSVRKHRNLRLLAVEKTLLPVDDLKGALLLHALVKRCHTDCTLQA